MRVVSAARRSGTFASAMAAAMALAMLAGGCTDSAPEQPAAPGAASGAASAAAASALTNRVWIKSAPDAPLGSMLMFLSDGTLVQDSCWETYRLSKWSMDGTDMLRWQEDTAGIAAAIVALTPNDLTLRFDLVGGPETASYRAAAVPYVCPDMPR